MLRGFYAFEDTKTPAGITLVMNIVTIVAASISYAILPIRWITVGIAISFGVGYLASSLWARHLLTKRIGNLILGRNVVLITVISVIAFAPSIGITYLVEQSIGKGSATLISSAVALAISGILASIIYLGLGYRLKIAPVTLLGDSLRKRISRR